MNKFLILFFCLSTLNVFAGTNEINYLDQEGKRIVYKARNVAVKSVNDIEKVAQKPKETMVKRTGSCIDTAVLIKDLAQKEGLKAEVKLVNKGKHAICIVTDGVKKYKFSNGKRRY